MDTSNWKARIADGTDTARESAHAAIDTLSQSARDAAAVARARIEETYGQARARVADLNIDGKQIAASGAELAEKARVQGRKTLDKATLASRDLIAERPLAAVAVGITAGVLLGFLANRLVRPTKLDADESDEIGA